MTIEPDSFGFDKDHLVVALNKTDQKFGLIFLNGGLAANNLLHFSLNVDKALTTPPTLEITSPGSLQGVVLKAEESTPITPPVNGGPSASIPEPMSMLVWSALAGLGLLRARGLRRAKLAPA